MRIVHSITYIANRFFSVLLPVDVTCIEKLNPITMFHMNDGNVLGYNIASSYYPLIKIC